MAGEARDMVKALGKGLTVLAELNRCNGLSVAALGERVRMPRPTAARIIATLEAAGYVYQCPADGKFRVTSRVRRLTRGCAGPDWLQGAAQPVADGLARRLGWPVMVARFEQRRVRLVCLTDTASSVLEERRTLGERIPLVGSALGLCYLAFAAEDPVEDIMQATRSDDPQGAAARIGQVQRMSELIEISRSRGHVVHELPGRTAIAAPLVQEGRVSGAIGVRMPLPADRLAARAEIAAAVCAAAGEISLSLGSLRPRH